MSSINFVPLTGLDNLEPLRDLVGDARVVAIGESAHFVKEFNFAREHLLHFLADRCGFTTFAFEFGFREAFALEPWLYGEGPEEGLATYSKAASAWGSKGLMHFLRRHNLTSARPLRFVGIDIPEAGGSLLPVLHPVADYLREVDPDVLPLIEASIETASRFAGASAASAAPAWAKLDAPTKDALTSTLARLLSRFRALAPRYVSRSDQGRYDLSLRYLEAACHTDYMLRAMSDLFAGKAIPGDVSVRDLFMAESVRWHLERAGSGARMILAAHNNHIQKTPVHYSGQFSSLPMGHYLSRMFGQQYVSIAITSTADHIPDMVLDESAVSGFKVVDAPLPPPPTGSLEAAALAAGAGLSLVNLRVAPTGLDRIRSQSSYMQTPLREAFDGALVIPTASLEESIDL